MNMKKLRMLMYANGFGMQKLAKESGIKQATLYRSLSKGGKSFTIEEIAKISSVLGLSSAEIVEIFLPWSLKNENLARLI